MTLARKLLERLSPESAFVVFSASLCTAVLAVLSTEGYWEKPLVVGPALMADLALGLPALGYLSLVRTRRMDRKILLPLFLLGAFLARWWIPEAHRMGSDALKLGAVVLEGGLLLYLAIRIRRIHALYTAEKPRQPYPGDAARVAFTTVLGRSLGAAVYGEGAALWYSLSGWRRSPASGIPGTRFPGYRRNAYPALLGAILFLIVIETGVVHLLVALWSDRAAWILTALGIYTLLWLVGDLHAARLNQTMVSDFGLHLRTGLRWHADIPWPQIRAIRTDPPAEKGVRMSLLGQPELWVQFREPQTIGGILGIRRRTTNVGLGLDDPEGFRELVESRIAGGGRRVEAVESRGSGSGQPSSGAKFGGS